MNKRVLRDSFKAWSQMVIDKKKIMATWKTKGLFLMRKQLSGRVRTPFSILCYYAYCRSYLRKVYLYQYYYFYLRKTKYDCSSKEVQETMEIPEGPLPPSKYNKLSITVVGFDVVCLPMRDSMMKKFEHNHLFPMKFFYTHSFKHLLHHWKICAKQSNKERSCLYNIYYNSIHGSLIILKRSFEKWLTYHVNYKEKVKQIAILKTKLEDMYKKEFDKIEKEFQSKDLRLKSELEGTFALLNVCKMEYHQTCVFREDVEKDLVNDLQDVELQSKFIEAQVFYFLLNRHLKMKQKLH